MKEDNRCEGCDEIVPEGESVICAQCGKFTCAENSCTDGVLCVPCQKEYEEDQRKEEDYYRKQEEKSK